MNSRLMHRSSMVALLTVGVALASCSSDSTNNGGSTACSFTLSGALTGTPTCTPLGTFWTSDDNKTAFGFAPNFSSDPSVLVTIAFAGEAAAATYHETDAGAVAAISVSSGSSQWAMQTADGGTPASGSYTLTISSVSTVTSDASTKVYQVHGTLTATLPAVQGGAATGTVTLKATF